MESSHRLIHINILIVKQTGMRKVLRGVNYQSVGVLTVSLIGPAVN